MLNLQLRKRQGESDLHDAPIALGCHTVRRAEKSVRKLRGEGTHSTLKASLALLCGCLHTMNVRIRQTTKITPRTDSDQGAHPPWTATIQKMHTKTPAGEEKQDLKERSSEDVLHL